MKTAKSAKTALLMIDVQNGFLDPSHWGTSRSTPECETNIATLLNSVRGYNDKLSKESASDENSILICHIHHHSIYPDSALRPGVMIDVDGQSLEAVKPQSFAAPRQGESIWVKDVNSGFVGTGLEAFLRSHQVKQLVICGLTTDHCVSTTTRMANNLRVVATLTDDGRVVDEGDIILASDACATYAKGAFDAETVHQVSLASLDDEFAQVKKTADVVRVVLEG